MGFMKSPGENIRMKIKGQKPLNISKEQCKAFLV
jgi:hypothetical protein